LRHEQALTASLQEHLRNINNENNMMHGNDENEINVEDNINNENNMMHGNDENEISGRKQC
jgi:hypothetical protein